MTLIYGGKLQAWGEKCCYLTFIKMLAIVFFVAYYCSFIWLWALL